MSDPFFKPLRGDGRGGVSPEYTFRPGSPLDRLVEQREGPIKLVQADYARDLRPPYVPYDGPACDGWHDGRPCPDPDRHAIVEVIHRVQVSRGLRAKCSRDHGITTCVDPDCYRRPR